MNLMNLRLSLFSFCTSALITVPLHAQFSDGVLDTTFDGDGIVQTDFGNNLEDRAYAVAAQADGKTVVAGYSVVAGKYQVALARYTVAGALDTSFGSGGRVLTDAGPDHDQAYAVAIQPDDKIVVAGWTYGTSFDFLVVRYTATGALDGSFGTGGVVTIPISGDTDIANSLALQSDGKILVAGYASIAGSQDFAVVRLTDTGALDTSFSDDGIATVNMGSSAEYAGAVAVQSDGKIILVGGSTLTGGSYDFALARLTVSGALDVTFGTAGRVTTSLVAGSDYAGSVIIQTTGEIIAAGGAINGGSEDFALVRYTSTGALDTSFGTGGIVLTPISAGSEVCRGVVLQNDGKIIAAGSTSVGPGSFATLRYTSTGALDTSFGTEGKVTTAFGAYGAAGYGVAMHGDGRVVVAGDSYSFAGSLDFGVVMFRVPLPDIAVAAGSPLSDGIGSLSLGAAIAGQDGAPLTFTITNPGSKELNNLAITKNGTDAEDFEVSALSGTNIPVGGGSVTFSVTFSPATGGMKNVALQIASNVSGTRNPFDIALTATALGMEQDTDNDGLNDVAEYQMAALGFNWQVAQTALVETYFATANGAGLFKASQVQALRLPTPQIQRDSLTGEFTLAFGLEKSTTVQPAAFAPFPVAAPQISIVNGKFKIQVPSQGDAAYFRLSSR